MEDLEWPYDFEGHTLTREASGLRCLECGKGASDIAGRPRWGYFREFRCVPKRRCGRPRRRAHTVEPTFLEESGATLVRPGRARPRARSAGLAGPLRVSATQEFLARPELPYRPDLSLLRETQDSLVRPGGHVSRGLSLQREAWRTLARPGVPAALEGTQVTHDDGG
eukprot:2323756-Amphidinium_carterae.1